MNIAIIGVGNVGASLAKKFASIGHSVLLGARDPHDNNVNNLAQQLGTLATVMSVKEAALNAEIVALAIPWNAAEEVVKSLHDVVKGKVLIDCTNPLNKDFSALVVGQSTSGGELVQSWAPQALVYKCFNTTGFNIMSDPELEGRKTVMFYCSDDNIHRDVVAGLVKDLGFECIDVGPISTSRLLEPFALLWIQLAYKFGVGRDFSFGILRRE